MAQRSLKRVVLVHGGVHGAWCWEALAPLLEARGLAVSAPDLPSHGEDKTPPSEVSLKSYIDRVVDTVRAGPTPVLLVGHSLGGAVITQVGEEMPEAIGKLVYVSAMMLADGEAISSFRTADLGAEREKTAARGFMAGKGGAHGIDPAMAPDIFYHLCPPDVAGRAVARLCPQADQPLVDPVRLTEARFGALPKTYIICTEDRAIPPSRQRFLAARRPETRVLELKSDHSPFYSCTSALADMLVRECEL